MGTNRVSLTPLTGIRLYAGLAAVFLFVFVIGNAYSEKFTKKEYDRAGLKLIRQAKTVRIIEKQTYPTLKDYSLPFKTIVAKQFESEGITIVPSDRNDADFTITIEAKGYRIEIDGGADISRPKLTAHAHSHRTILDGRIRISSKNTVVLDEGFQGKSVSMLDHQDQERESAAFYNLFKSSFVPAIRQVFDEIFNLDNHKEASDGEQKRMLTASL